ncbi:MAG: hypothetical protein ACI4CT_03380 [Lachnospiraceae bacterium]
MGDLVCNVCGKTIVQENGIPREDFLEITKAWGYFSKKDGETHKILVCESCYEAWVAQFKKKVEIVDTKELI